jgi:hypothetical protein
MWCAPAPAACIDVNAAPCAPPHARPLAAAGISDYIATIMRAEITAIVEDIKQSLGLLRRHL